MLKTQSKICRCLAVLTVLLWSGTPVMSEQVHFQSGFETVDDFAGFYITPNAPDASARHSIEAGDAVSGDFAHHAWITRPNPESSFFKNRNQRAYPTIQFQKTQIGPRPTPVCVSLYVWADIELSERAGSQEDQWLSLATFTDDVSDRWRRSVLVNVSHRGAVHLQHVPLQGQQEHIFQSDGPGFTYRTWQHLEIELDFSPMGYAKVWLDNVLQSHAHVAGVEDQLAQAHFGLYASPSLAAGEVRNDDLRITAGLCHPS